jgi:hypothetical protein
VLQHSNTLSVVVLLVDIQQHGQRPEIVVREMARSVSNFLVLHRCLSQRVAELKRAALASARPVPEETVM